MHDCIVLGVGGAGSAALYHLARRGVNVVGIDRFPPGHGRGSSHGQTRMLRLAYFEHPDYVPLLRRAYQLWAELEQEHGVPLYRETGVVQAGPPDGVVLTGVLEAARLHGLDVEEVDSVPGLAWPDSMRAIRSKALKVASKESASVTARSMCARLSSSSVAFSSRTCSRRLRSRASGVFKSCVMLSDT